MTLRRGRIATFNLHVPPVPAGEAGLVFLKIDWEGLSMA